MKPGSIEQCCPPRCRIGRPRGECRAGAPDVYVGASKTGSLGLRVRRGCTLHGLAFNVAMDLESFQRIDPCGYKGLAVSQMLDYGGPSVLTEVEDVLIDVFCAHFGYRAQVAAPLVPRLTARETGRVPLLST